MTPARDARRSLGRGLGSLIPDDALSLDPASDRNRVRQVPIDEVLPNPDQPRERFDDTALISLADSIRTHGILAPLVARRQEGKYVLLAGERRLRAAALAGLGEVPILVRDVDDPSTSLEIALVENLLREDLDPLECARGFQRLIEDFGLTQEEVARRVGRDRATVANLIRLLKLPLFVRTALREGRLTAGHARAMLPLATDDDYRRVLARIETQQLNVRQVERLVSELTKARPRRTTVTRSQRVALELVARSLQDSLAASVSITPHKRGGAIVIRYADAADLDRLVTHLKPKST